MAFSEADRVEIRRYMGLSSLYLKNNSRFEDAISLIQGPADGGAMADNSTELKVKAALAEIALIELELKNSRIQFSVNKAGSDDIELSPGRGVFLLKSEARRHVRYIANTIGVDLDASDSLVF